MTDFSFKKIDAPGPAGNFAYISVDGVDAAGLAVGNFGNVDGDGDGTFHGFAAQAGGSYTIDDPPGSSNTDIVGITPGGEIFGDYVDSANKQHGFVENDGVFTNVDMFLANSTVVYGVNAAGVIYGTYASSTNGVFGFTDNNGSFALVAVPGAFSTSVAGMNASGAIVGTYTDAQSVAHGYVDNNGNYTSFDPAGSIFTSVVGISDGGKIVGNYQDSSNNTYGFIDNNGVITTINIPGSTSSGVQAVNAGGEVVGYYIDGSNHVHGFIDNGGAITTVDVPGATYTDIVGISATGVISGYYDDSSFIQHGFVGTPLPVTVIESYGSTSLAESGNNYFLDSNSTGAGPEVMYGGSPLTVGEFAWTPIAAEQTSTGYEIALTNAGQFTVWVTDSSGNVLYDPSGNLAGNSAALEAYETSFHQDLNGDGVIGSPATTLESFGSTSLVQTGNNYFLDSNSTGTGPEVIFGSSPLTAGEFAWTPIGAEQTSTGYEIALKDAGQYTVWVTDSSGNVLYDPSGTMSATSTTLETYETSFHQDLNGDGVIGIPTGTTIESFGSTSLVQDGNNYFLDSNSTGTGPEVIYGTAPLTAGEFAWTPIAAEQTSTGYEIALKAAGQYTVWVTDSSGNVLYDPSGNMSATSTALETYETSFHQDLNGDGVIGIPTGTTIESFGSTSLVQVGNDYFLNSNSTGTGPEVIYGASALTVGEFAWTPIGAEQTSTGYEIALKDGASGPYTVWVTDSSGNVLYDPSGNMSATSLALENYETSFHQDLNGDGVIGQAVASAGTLGVTGADAGAVTFNGATGTLILEQSTSFSGQLLDFTGNGNLSSSDQLDLRDIGYGAGTTVGYAGTAAGGTLTITDAQNHTAHIELTGDYTSSTFSLSSDNDGGTIVIDPADNHPAAEGTLSFSDPDPTDTHTVSVTPQNGGAGYLGSFVADAANGQDTVGWHFNFDSSPVTQTATQSYAVTVADHHADGTISAATQMVSVTIAGPGNDAFVFHPGVGSGTIVNASSSDTIELDGFAAVANSNQLASLLHDAQTGQAQSLFHSANGGQDTVIDLGNHDSITLSGVQIADLHAGNFIIH